MATVELKPVSDLFGYDFFVPSYQRGYRWTSVQVRELLEDLYDFAEENPIIKKLKIEEFSYSYLLGD